jgi:transcriptional regulator with XRE-family HTH domain
MNRFGTHIRQVRTNLGLTQAEVARSAGITTSAISEMESGGRPPSVANTRAVVAALGIARPYPAIAQLEWMANRATRRTGVAPDTAYDQLVTELRIALNDPLAAVIPWSESPYGGVETGYDKP